MAKDRATPPPAVANGADPGAPSDAPGGAASDAATLERELGEIDMLITQARTEAGRHEQKRAAAAEKLAALVEQRPGEAVDIVEQYGQLVTLTRRAAVMEAQVDVLRGKQRAIARYRDSLAAYAEALAGLAAEAEVAAATAAAAREQASLDAAHASSPGMSRVVVSAQEDLRREIARAMHDGPAQSLTNIVLQAQIVDRLLGQDEAMARGELRQLVAMVQQTLDATKTFIFDVRPMVLDDLGLVPTLRRVARERGRRAQVPVSFESDGQDRRLSVDLESAVFRIVDDALAAYLEQRPDRATMLMRWDPGLSIDVAASNDPPPEPAPEDVLPEPGADVPPALAAMIEDRRAAARPVAREPSRLPEAVWREASARAGALGIKAELLDDGCRLRLVVPLTEGA
jgi:two-component system sensor histidine kinase DegS